jgi:hypothetical protein
MSTTYATGASLGPAYTGQAIGYKLAGPSGSTVAAWTSAGVTETTIAGDYDPHGVTLPAGFTGSILWGLTGQTPLASEEITGPIPLTPNPYLASVSLGAAYASQAIGYRLFNLDGTAAAGSLGTFSTSGVSAGAVPGDYSVAAGISLPSNFQGRIVWGTSGSDLAEEWINAGLNSTVAVTTGTGRPDPSYAIVTRM